MYACMNTRMCEHSHSITVVTELVSGDSKRTAAQNAVVVMCNLLA